MPVQFPTADPNDPTTLRTLDYYSVDEVADMLHLSTSTVRARLASGAWPCLDLGVHRRFLSAEHIATIMELSTRGVADAMDAPPRIGTPVTDADTEGLR